MQLETGTLSNKNHKRVSVIWHFCFDIYFAVGPFHDTAFCQTCEFVAYNFVQFLPQLASRCEDLLMVGWRIIFKSMLSTLSLESIDRTFVVAGQSVSSIAVYTCQYANIKFRFRSRVLRPWLDVDGLCSRPAVAWLGDFPVAISHLAMPNNLFTPKLTCAPVPG